MCDISKNTESLATDPAATDWTHDGKDGAGELVINLSDDPDDRNSTSILVRGRNREAVAKQLAALLNKERFAVS